VAPAGIVTDTGEKLPDPVVARFTVRLLEGAAPEMVTAIGVVVPGTLVYRALRGPVHTLVEDIAMGAAVGLVLELAAWVEDPEQGKTNLRSEIYYGIWQEFKARGVVIPYPQREVRLVGGTPAEKEK